MRVRNVLGALRAPLYFAAVAVAMILAYLAGSYAADMMMPSAEPVKPPVIEGDDNGDGTVDESESGWDCATMGNGVCRTPAV